MINLSITIWGQYDPNLIFIILKKPRIFSGVTGQFKKVKPMKKHIQVKFWKKSFNLRFYGIFDKTYFSKSRKNLTPPKSDSDRIFARFMKNGVDSFFGVNLTPKQVGVKLTPTF